MLVMLWWIGVIIIAVIIGLTVDRLDYGTWLWEKEKRK